MSQRILVVDDDPGILVTIEGMLELAGYEVELARDGLEALQKVQARPPQLMLLDIMMPRMDGFGVAAALQTQGSYASIPIIVLTADGRAQAKAAQLGARGYISKPFAFQELMQAIMSTIGPA